MGEGEVRTAAVREAARAMAAARAAVVQETLRGGGAMVFAAAAGGAVETAEARAQRTIRAEWLEQLAEQTSGKFGAPITVRNAVIEGPLRLMYATFEGEVCFTDCEFAGPVDLSFTVFERNLILSGCRFDDWTSFRGALLERNGYVDGTKFFAYWRNDKGVLIGRAIFEDLHVQAGWWADGMTFGKGVWATFEHSHFENSLFFRGAVFEAGGTFRDCRIGGHAEFVEAQFRGKETVADFEMLSVEGYASFLKATFEGTARFQSVRVGDAGFFGGATFAQFATFNGSRFRGVFFRGDRGGAAAAFEGGVDFTAAEFEVNAEFTGVQFRGENALVNFDRVRIKGDAFFEGASFGGEARFLFVDIGIRAAFQGAVFRKLANFNNARVRGLALFRPEPSVSLPGARFEGVADFRGAQIGSNAEFQDCMFEGPALFMRMEVEGLAIFQRTRFMTAGKGVLVSFEAARIKGDAFFQEVNFAGDATFNFIDVGGVAAFQGAVFGGKASFNGARVRGFFFRAEPDRDPKVPGAVFGGETDFTSAETGGNAEFDECTFQGPARFSGAQIGGRAIFRGARFPGGSPLFQGARFQQGATFNGTHFDHGGNFNTTHFGTEARFHGAVFGGPANFAGSNFNGEAHFAAGQNQDGLLPGAKFAEVSFEDARFEEDVHFEETLFQGKATFRESVFRGVFFSPTGRLRQQAGAAAVEQFQGAVDFRGCVYDRIQADWKSMLRREERGGRPAGMGYARWQGSRLLSRYKGPNPRQEPYERQPYVQLEASLRKAGDARTADEVYLEGWRVVRKARWVQRKPNRAPWSWMLAALYGFLGNYGQRPVRLVIIPPILLLLAGWCVFSRSGAVQLKTDLQSKGSQAATTAAVGKTGGASGGPTEGFSRADALRLTARLLLPVEVPLAAKWEPSERTWKAWNMGRKTVAVKFTDFATFLRIAAWILAFLWVAAFQGWLQWTPK